MTKINEIKQGQIILISLLISLYVVVIIIGAMLIAKYCIKYEDPQSNIVFSFVAYGKK